MLLSIPPPLARPLDSLKRHEICHGAVPWRCHSVAMGFHDEAMALPWGFMGHHDTAMAHGRSTMTIHRELLLLHCHGPWKKSIMTIP